MTEFITILIIYVGVLMQKTTEIKALKVIKRGINGVYSNKKHRNGKHKLILME
jgi:hypothetical protein